MEAVSTEDRIPHEVMVGLDGVIVLTAIDFDDEAMVEAHEVEKIPAERRLPAEMVTLSSQRTQT